MAEVISAVYRVELDDRATELVAYLQRLLARKMGVPDDQPVPASLDFLADARRSSQSFAAYLATTEAHRLALERWQAARLKDPEARKPEPLEVLQPLFDDLLPFELFGADRRLEARLALPVEPFATNGVWAGEGPLTWSRKDICKKIGMPTYLYAAWSEPDAAAQRRHLGKASLNGRALAEYVLWRNGLGAAEAKQWDAFVASLEPGADLLARLQAFRFAGEQPPGTPDAPTRSLADTPVELIAAALEKAKPQP